MKRRILLILLAISFSLASASISVSTLKSETLQLYDDGGGGAGGGIERIRVLSVPFVNATIESGEYIDVYIRMNGTLEIEIADAMGFVKDKKTADTVVTGHQLRIDISDLPSGEYKIIFKKKGSKETRMGSFIID